MAKISVADFADKVEKAESIEEARQRKENQQRLRAKLFEAECSPEGAAILFELARASERFDGFPDRVDLAELDG